jgi:hypothetical protein
MIWRYLEPFSIFVSLMYPLRTDPPQIKLTAKIQRHLSIHFNTRFFKGITHEEILSEVEKKGRIRQCWFCAVHGD